MTNGNPITLFALDCGATHWRLYRAEYRQLGNQVQLQGDPQPAPLTSFSDRVLPAVILLDPTLATLDQIGEPAQANLEDENTRDRVRDYFKPCIGAQFETDLLPHQTRYSHAQALEFTRLLLRSVLAQIQSEKWRSNPFDDRLRFAFAYPVHWKYAHEGQILADFEAVVRETFPPEVWKNIRFVPEPEGAILSLQRQGLLESAADGITLIVDVGGSTTDIVAGKVNPHSGELLYLAHYGQSFGGGLYDAAMADYLAAELEIPSPALLADPAALATLRIYGQRLKEALSRQLLANQSNGQTAQRMITLVLKDGQIFRRLVHLDQAGFNRVAGQLDKKFQQLMDQALQTMGLEAADISQIALVGGGVQLFSIIRHLRARFGVDKVVLADNPDEIVVRGVALEYGATLDTFEPGVSLILPPAAVPQAKKQESAPVQQWGLETPDGDRHLLKSGITKIGRARAAQIWLDSEKVSRNHAQIQVEAEIITFTDLGSTNGSFINQVRIEPNQLHPLKLNDEIRCGDRKFILTADNC
jgi:hypothetical protein